MARRDHLPAGLPVLAGFVLALGILLTVVGISYRNILRVRADAERTGQGQEATAQSAARTVRTIVYGSGLSVLLLAAAGLLLYREMANRHSAERALRENEALYRTVLSHFPAGAIMLLDRDLRFRLAEGTGLAAHGLSPEMLVGRKPLEVFPPEFAEKRMPDYEAALEGKGAVSEVVYGDHTYRSHLVPLHGSDGTVTSVMVMAQDVTEPRRAEEEIRRLNREVEKSVDQLTTLNQELEAFSYSVSHDLRAPLRHISGYVDLLRRRAGDALDEGARRHMEAVSVAARYMGQLIDDLLAFSQMGRQEFLRQPVDLGQLLNEVMVELQREPREREVQWITAPLPEVSGDAAMLRLVLVNLLGNALKYTRDREQPVVEVGTRPGENGDLVVVFVRDNGVGFDMRYAEKLFGVFQRLHRADQFEGTGIGLATVRRIVHRHGGRCWAEAAVDQGATFYISLPKRDT